MSLLREAGVVDVPETQSSQSELAGACAAGDYDVVLTQLTDRLDADALAAAKVRGVSNYAVGFDIVDLTAATAHGVLVANTPGVLTEPTADITMLLILATARRCVEGDALLRGGGFTGWAPELPLGQDVTGALLGLVGSGRIATATARRAAGFNMAIQPCSGRGPHNKPGDSWAHGARRCRRPVSPPAMGRPGLVHPHRRAAP